VGITTNGCCGGACAAIIFWTPIPTPSKIARRIAQPIAPFLEALIPPRIAREPPVKKPAITARREPCAWSEVGWYRRV